MLLLRLDGDPLISLKPPFIETVESKHHMSNLPTVQVLYEGVNCGDVPAILDKLTHDASRDNDSHARGALAPRWDVVAKSTGAKHRFQGDSWEFDGWGKAPYEHVISTAQHQGAARGEQRRTIVPLATSRNPSANGRGSPTIPGSRTVPGPLRALQLSGACLELTEARP